MSTDTEIVIYVLHVCSFATTASIRFWLALFRTPLTGKQLFFFHFLSPFSTKVSSEQKECAHREKEIVSFKRKPLLFEMTLASREANRKWAKDVCFFFFGVKIMAGKHYRNNLKYWDR